MNTEKAKKKVRELEMKSVMTADEEFIYTETLK